MPTQPLLILLVEDDDLDREQVHRMVDGQWRVADAGTAQEAERQLQQQKPDCVLLDFQLPDTDGIHMLPRFVERDVPVVMMTGHGDEQTAVEAMKQGAYDYLPKKNLAIDSLRRAVTGAVERAALQRKLKDQQEELRMFASVAAHDLKAPLRTVIQFSNFLEQEIQEENYAKVQEYCQRLQDAGQRMNHLVDALLEYSRTGRSGATFEPVDLNDVVREARAWCETMIQDSHGRVEAQQLPKVHGDRTGLCQLFQNLVANGLKFCPKDRHPCIRISAQQQGDTWELRVQDNGIGISSDSFEKVFQPFCRLNSRSEYDGTGLGLALCKKVIDQHGGRIWVESENGQGSTFCFTLPASP